MATNYLLIAATFIVEKWLPYLNFQNYTSETQILSQSLELNMYKYINMYGHWYIVLGSVWDKDKLLFPLQTLPIACLPPLISNKWQGVKGNTLCFT